MLDQYIDINGQLMGAREPAIAISNRSFKFGDGLFETMRSQDGAIAFLPYHLDRLRHGMQVLQLEGNHLLDIPFLNARVATLLNRNRITGAARVRLNVYREGEGLYSPETNKAGYVLEVNPLQEASYALNKMGLIIDVFLEHKKPTGLLSSLKTNNGLLYVLAGAKRKTAGLDDLLLLNQADYLCEATSSNIFVQYKGHLYTPALSEGCVDGVMRRAVIDIAREMGIEVIEAQINPKILHEADELFLTNAIQGIQWVMGYGKKRYFNHVTKQVYNALLPYELAVREGHEAEGTKGS